MKIATEIGSAAKRIGEEKAIGYVAEAGFDAWDFSMFCMCGRYDWRAQKIYTTDHPLAGREYLQYARKLKRVADDYGIVCNQSHAPFPSMAVGMVDYIKRAIECTAEVGGKICVVHPANECSPEENGELFRQLLPFAKSYGVKLATENMWNWDAETDMPAPAACSTADSFLQHLEVMHDEDFVACLDIGHAEMIGAGFGAPEMIRKLGHHLQAVHMHDNDRKHDNHQIPFSMNIDFGEVMRALREISYAGYCTLEADAYLSKYEDGDIPKGLKEMAEAARRLAEMYDGRE